jgi:mRNA interferase MazF
MLHPGDVVVVDFAGAMGAKPRPAVVVSTDLYNGSRPDVVLALLTTQVAKATQPTDCLIQDWKAAGLHAASAFRAYFLTELQANVRRRIGALSARDWQEVQARLRMALAVT